MLVLVWVEFWAVRQGLCLLLRFPFGARHKAEEILQGVLERCEKRVASCNSLCNSFGADL